MSCLRRTLSNPLLIFARTKISNLRYVRLIFVFSVPQCRDKLTVKQQVEAKDYKVGETTV